MKFKAFLGGGAGVIKWAEGEGRITTENCCIHAFLILY